MKRVFFVLLTFIFLLLACTPQKRLNRLIKKHPDLIQKTDTIIIDDTLVIPGAKVDTAIFINFDTIFLEKEKLQVRLIRLHDSIYITGECLPDTIIRRLPVAVPVVTVETNSKISFIKIIGFCCLCFIISFFAFRKR